MQDHALFVLENRFQKYHPDIFETENRQSKIFIFSGKQNLKDSVFRLGHPCSESGAVFETTPDELNRRLDVLELARPI